MNKYLKNSKVRVVIRNLLILLTYTAICYLINIKYNILGLFIDDLNSFMYFPNHNIFEYAFKFYDEATRYRPFYEFFQYIAFFIANHNPHILYLINIIFNGFITYYLYIKTKRMHNNKYLSLAISILYLITHFAIYQISQATGLMESIATFLSLVIFFIGIDIIKRFSLGKIAKINILFIFISLTHERYLSLFGFLIITYIMTLLCNHDSRKVVRLLIGSMVLSIISLTFVIFIRYLAIGRIVPAGTSGTYVVNTFSFNSLFGFMKEEFLYICGINVGNEAMGGILFNDLDILSKTVTSFHLVSVVLIVIFHVFDIFNLHMRNNKNVFENTYIDIMFVTIILLTVMFSSVTVFIEKRFIVVPFIFTYMYVFYMIACLYKDNEVLKNVFLLLIVVILSFGLIVSRLYIENSYRKENEKIYFMVDQKRLNNLAKHTVIKYGKHIIDEKQIYIVANSYLYTPRYLENYFVIYQSNYEKRPIKVISEMSEEEIKLIDYTKSIILAEDRGKDDYYETTFNLNQILSN